MNGTSDNLEGGKSSRRGDGASALKSLSEGELVDLYNAIRLYVAKIYYGPLDSDDIAMQAITDVLANKRSWNPEFSPLRNLCLIAKSIASNRLEKDKRLTQLDCDETNTVAASTPTSTLRPTTPSLVEALEASEKQCKLGELLRRAVSGDDALHRMVLFALGEEKWTPTEIATALNINKSEVHNAKKRLRRRLSILRTKL